MYVCLCASFVVDRYIRKHSPNIYVFFFPFTWKKLKATQVTSPPTAPPLKTEEGEVKPEKEEDKPPRKERSLGKLCENFMGLFADVPVDDHNNGTVIEICEIASRMRVQRRRIYDVINILEAIDVVTRVKKNTYQWHGLEGLHAFFANMQKEALAERSSATAAAVAAATGVET